MALNEHGLQYNSKQKKCFFGSYALSTDKFRFELGETKTLLSTVRYVKSIVDKEKENNGLEHFAEFFKLSRPQSYERNLIPTVFGKVFGSLQEKRQGELVERSGNQQKELFGKASLMFTNFKTEEIGPKREFTLEMVSVTVDGERVNGKVTCTYCDVTNVSAEVCVYLKPPNCWVTANLKSHLARHHTKIQKTLRKTIQLQIEPVNETNGCANRSDNTMLNELGLEEQNVPDTAQIYKSISDPLYAQLSAQCIRMANSTIRNGDEVLTNIFGMSSASSAESRGIKCCRVAGFGDCFFLAVAHQLNSIKIASDQHVQKASVLRENVVSYVKEKKNFPNFVHDLKNRIRYDKSAKSTVIEKACLDFLDDKLSATGCLAGMESIKAISEMKKVNIVVLNDDGSCNLPNHFNFEYDKAILILFSSASGNSNSNVDRNHYDSVVGMNHEIITKVTNQLSEHEYKYWKFVNESADRRKISLE